MLGGVIQSIKIGCCGFARSREEYYKVFPVVEVQQTFYQPPRIETVQGWRKEAPMEFEFTLKAWQLITHKPTSPTYRRLREDIPDEQKSRYGFFQPTPEVFEAWRRTREIAKMLEARVVVFQCPASFEPTESHKQNMREFFLTADRDKLFFCWEPRGKWEEDEIRNLCEELDLIHCVDPFTRVTTHGSIRYYRLHGIGGYRYRYTESDLENLLQSCPEVMQTYTMFNNLSMWEDACRFLIKLEEKYR